MDITSYTNKQLRSAILQTEEMLLYCNTLQWIRESLRLKRLQNEHYKRLHRKKKQTSL